MALRNSFIGTVEFIRFEFYTKVFVEAIKFLLDFIAIILRKGKSFFFLSMCGVCGLKIRLEM